jgi:EAL domain-containing protein (putative c-di-GMP-specific phosphodiesterase class I)/ActR/RegA family two-component response regulator
MENQAQQRSIADVASPAVLVVDDESAVARVTERMLVRHGYRVTVAASGREALQKMDGARFDAIVSDLGMPEMDGRALLRAIRAKDLDVPFVVLTGMPDVNSAIEAVEYGAFRYLIKPVPQEELLDVVTKAVHWHRLAVVRREAAAELQARPVGDRAGLENQFASAIEKLWMATQPIVSWPDKSVIAYEALVRTDEPTLRNPANLFDVAERLGRVTELGRAIRKLVARLLPEAPKSALVFVNLHPADLEDEELLSDDGMLTRFSERIVLEITERATLESISSLSKRVGRLRELGFRLAVDDLGAGYAGLSNFASLEPEIVKADMSLVRGIDSSPLKQKLMRTIATLTHDLKIRLVAEGIETEAERDCLLSLGASTLQGYLFAKPGRGFPTIKA